MGKYTFTQDEKTTLWFRTRFTVEAASQEKAEEFLKQNRHKHIEDLEAEDPSVDIIVSEMIPDTGEYLLPSENGGQATIEVCRGVGADWDDIVCTNADSGEETGSCDGRTLSDMLSALSKEAFARAKTALRRLGGTVTLENPVTLHIDTCNDSGFLFTLEAGTVRLSGDTVEVFAKGADIERIKSDPDSTEPDEYWCEGGEWYAEWEGLLELFDIVAGLPENRRKRE